ncbi:MAG TPA: helix-turn-helix domain-containing protein [Acidimicrobiales bacterium]|nr:helix-turn-helix domain-containing protein [Acidimicrobiales bacterium]
MTDHPSVPERLLTTAQVSEYLAIPVSTLHVWRHRGVGPPSLKVGRHLRYRRGDVETWLQSRASAQPA